MEVEVSPKSPERYFYDTDSEDSFERNVKSQLQRACAWSRAEPAKEDRHPNRRGGPRGSPSPKLRGLKKDAQSISSVARRIRNIERDLSDGRCGPSAAVGSESSSLAADSRDLRSKLSMTRVVLKDVQQKLQEARAHSQRLETQNTSLVSERSALQEQLSRRERGLQSEKRRLSEMESELASLRRENARLRERLRCPAVVSSPPSGEEEEAAGRESTSVLPSRLRSEVQKLRDENDRMRRDLQEVSRLYKELRERSTAPGPAVAVAPSSSDVSRSQSSMESHWERKENEASFGWAPAADTRSLRSQLASALRSLSESNASLRARDRSVADLTSTVSSLRVELEESRATTAIVRQQLRLVESTANEALSSREPVSSVGASRAPGPRDQEIAELRRTVAEMRLRLSDSMPSPSGGGVGGRGHPPRPSAFSPPSEASGSSLGRRDSGTRGSLWGEDGDSLLMPADQVSVGIQVASSGPGPLEERLKQLETDRSLLETKVQSFQAQYRELREEYSMLEIEHSESLGHLQASFRELSDLKQRNSELESSLLLQTQSRSMSTSERGGGGGEPFAHAASNPSPSSPSAVDSRFLEQRCTELTELNADLTATNEILQNQIDQLKSRLAQTATTGGEAANAALSLQSFALPDSLLILSSPPPHPPRSSEGSSSSDAPRVREEEDLQSVTRLHTVDLLPERSAPRVLTTLFSQWDVAFASSRRESSLPPRASRSLARAPSPAIVAISEPENPLLGASPKEPQATEDRPRSRSERHRGRSSQTGGSPLVLTSHAPVQVPVLSSLSPPGGRLVHPALVFDRGMSPAECDQSPHAADGDVEEYFFSSPRRSRAVQSSRSSRVMRVRPDHSGDLEGGGQRGASPPLGSEVRLSPSKSLAVTPHRSYPLMRAVFSRCVTSSTSPGPAESAETTTTTAESPERDVMSSSLLTTSSSEKSSLEREAERIQLEHDLNDTLALLEQAVPLDEWRLVEREIEGCIAELDSGSLDAELSAAGLAEAELAVEGAMPLDYEAALALWEGLLLVFAQACSGGQSSSMPADMNIFRLNESTIHWSSGSSDSEESKAPSQPPDETRPLQAVTAVREREEEVVELRSSLLARAREVSELRLLVERLSSCGAPPPLPPPSGEGGGEELYARSEDEGLLSPIASPAVAASSVGGEDRGVAQRPSTSGASRPLEETLAIQTATLRTAESQNARLESEAERQREESRRFMVNSEELLSVLRKELQEKQREIDSLRARLSSLPPSRAPALEERSSWICLEPSPGATNGVAPVSSLADAEESAYSPPPCLSSLGSLGERSGVYDPSMLLDSDAADLLPALSAIERDSEETHLALEKSRRRASRLEGVVAEQSAALSHPSWPRECSGVVAEIVSFLGERGASVSPSEVSPFLSEVYKYLLASSAEELLLRNQLALTRVPRRLSRSSWPSVSLLGERSTTRPSPSTDLCALSLPGVPSSALASSPQRDQSELLLLLYDQLRSLAEELASGGGVSASSQSVLAASLGAPSDTAAERSSCPPVMQQSFAENDSYQQLLSKLVRTERSYSEKSREHITLLRRTSDMGSRLRSLESQLDHTSRSYESFMDSLGGKIHGLLHRFEEECAEWLASSPSSLLDRFEAFLREGLSELLMEIEGFQEVVQAATPERSPSSSGTPSPAKVLDAVSEAQSSSFGIP